MIIKTVSMRKITLIIVHCTANRARVIGTGTLTLYISVVKLIIGKTEVFCEERL